MTVQARLSGHIYPRHCVELTADAFRHLGDIKLCSQSERDLSVQVSASHEENLIMHEFLNYLLIVAAEEYLHAKTAIV
jgi:hypothetical protein